MGMRVPSALLAAVAATAALGAAAPAARAADPTPPPPCYTVAEHQGPNSYGETYSRLKLGALVRATIPVEQHGIIRPGPENGTYSVGVAPGPLDVAAARAAIEQRITQEQQLGNFSAADAAGAIAALRVVAMPYAYAKVQEAARTIPAKLFEAGLEDFETHAVCRVYIRLNLPNGRTELDRARQLVAPYGDIVWVEYGGTVGGPPTPEKPIVIPGGPTPLPDPPAEGGPGPARTSPVAPACPRAARRRAPRRRRRPRSSRSPRPCARPRPSAASAARRSRCARAPARSCASPSAAGRSASGRARRSGSRSAARRPRSPSRPPRATAGRSRSA